MDAEAKLRVRSKKEILDSFERKQEQQQQQQQQKLIPNEREKRPYSDGRDKELQRKKTINCQRLLLLHRNYSSRPNETSWENNNRHHPSSIIHHPSSIINPVEIVIIDQFVKEIGVDCIIVTIHSVSKIIVLYPCRTSDVDSSLSRSSVVVQYCNSQYL